MCKNFIVSLNFYEIVLWACTRIYWAFQSSGQDVHSKFSNMVQNLYILVHLSRISLCYTKNVQASTFLEHASGPGSGQVVN